MSAPRFRLAICGGGIGGLTLAAVLLKYSKQDIQIDIYESKDRFTEVGAGITVWKRTWHIFQLLGLDDALGRMAISPPVDEPRPGFQYRKADQKEGFNFYRIVLPYGNISVHRADMLKVLGDNIPEGFPMHFSKQLVRYSEDDAGVVTLFFADGSTAEADVVVGADGVKSAVRETMYYNLAKAVGETDTQKSKAFLDFMTPSWSGTYAYRTLFNTEKLMKIAPGHQATEKAMIYCGKNQHIACYPISRGKIMNMASLVTDTAKEGSKLEGHYMTDVPVKEMVDLTSDWEPEVQQLLACVEKATRWAICQVRGLPTFVSSRAALLGDSAHAMCPNLGAGAGQAMEDAFVLGRLLANDRVDRTNLHIVLQLYDSIRRPFSTEVQELSRKAGRCYQFNHIPESVRNAGVEVTSAEGLKLLPAEIYEAWRWNWTDWEEEEWVLVEKKLEELTSGSTDKAVLPVIG